MRWVTQKPPAMLTVVRINAALPRSVIKAPGDEIWRIAPMAMMLLMAFVTLIKGVCNAGVTFQITM